jgi:hypothetical protein
MGLTREFSLAVAGERGIGHGHAESKKRRVPKTMQRSAVPSLVLQAVLDFSCAFAFGFQLVQESGFCGLFSSQA